MDELIEILKAIDDCINEIETCIAGAKDSIDEAIKILKGGAK